MDVVIVLMSDVHDDDISSYVAGQLCTGVPRLLRTDCSTENTNLAFLQPYFRRIHNDCFSGSASFGYGKSISNQVHLLELYL